MSTNNIDLDAPPVFGTQSLRLPDELRQPLKQHMTELREFYVKHHWGASVGFGQRPALVVIDLAPWWTDASIYPRGTNLDSVVEATCRVLEPARAAKIPIFFSTLAQDPGEPESPFDRKTGRIHRKIPSREVKMLEPDPRLNHRPNEKIIRKPYASCFKGTNLHENLASLGVDTLIVTGVSTSHCVYATCRDAVDSYRVIVPREAVGERCELMHEVNLLDIELELADVLEVEQVAEYLKSLRP